MGKWNRLIRLMGTPSLLRQMLSLGTVGYLVDSGWTRSVLQRSPVDAEGCPIPWVTLPFIDFIGERLQRTLSVFEYGSGASTNYYARRVGKIDSVEHDHAWYVQLQGRLPASARVVLVALDRDGQYARACSHWGERYDLVVVDGRDRVNCMRHSLAQLSIGGCLMLDDSERPDYAEGCELMAGMGFRRLNFWGMAPGLNYKKCTSVFYRPVNCLSI